VRALLFLAAFVSLSAAASERYGEHLQRGDHLYRSHDNLAALREYEAAYREAPTAFEVLTRLTRLYSDLGRLALREAGGGESYHRQSLIYAEQLLRYHPERAETYFWLALCNGSLARYEGVRERIRLGKAAQEYALRAVAMDSLFAPAYIVLGIFYREAARLSWLEQTIVKTVFGTEFVGTLSESEAMLLRAIALAPDNIFAHAELARTYRAKGETEKAVRLLERAVSLPASSLREETQRLDAARQLRRMTEEQTPAGR
jgi:tetratricopeptide (TPR) repeat protein